MLFIYICVIDHHILWYLHRTPMYFKGITMVNFYKYDISILLRLSRGRVLRNDWIWWIKWIHSFIVTPVWWLMCDPSWCIYYSIFEELLVWNVFYFVVSCSVSCCICTPSGFSPSVSVQAYFSQYVKWVICRIHETSWRKSKKVEPE